MAKSTSTSAYITTCPMCESEVKVPLALPDGTVLVKFCTCQYLQLNGRGQVFTSMLPIGLVDTDSGPQPVDGSLPFYRQEPNLLVTLEAEEAEVAEESEESEEEEATNSTHDSVPVRRTPTGRPDSSNPE